MFRITVICDNCYIERKTTEPSTQKALKSLVDWAIVDVEGVKFLLCRDCLAAVGVLVPCPGEAHEIIRDGGDQDNCPVCAPMWGVVFAGDQPKVTRFDLLQASRKVREKRQRHTYTDVEFA